MPAEGERARQKREIREEERERKREGGRKKVLGTKEGKEREFVVYLGSH